MLWVRTKGALRKGVGSVAQNEVNSTRDVPLFSIIGFILKKKFHWDFKYVKQGRDHLSHKEYKYKG